MIPKFIDFNMPTYRRSINDCRVIDLHEVVDARGKLTIIESERDIPFPIQRVYYIHGVPHGSRRAGHAHKALHQLIIPISGSFNILLDDGEAKVEFTLNSSCHGLYIPPMIWRDIYNFTPGCVCMVFASAHFDEADYYRDYACFIKASNFEK
jgi:hypothetical protein